mmetsp:Transcript_57234/g.152931  ORF Transcript_57234/g.152931 Transcript_57234/m.152931 type:complete len:184 (-) Transcript_57234:216-767(-)
MSSAPPKVAAWLRKEVDEPAEALLEAAEWWPPPGTEDPKQLGTRENSIPFSIHYVVGSAGPFYVAYAEKEGDPAVRYHAVYFGPQASNSSTPPVAQGGAIASIFDVTMAFHAHSRHGKPAPTASLNVQYHRGLPCPGLYFLETQAGEIEDARKIPVVARLLDAPGGTVFASATCVNMILRAFL